MKNQNPGPLKRRFFLDNFNSMMSEFSEWRMDDYLKLLNKMNQKGWGKVLPFVRGLRLSARLIYIIRKNLNGTNLAADWGHLMNEAGDYLTPECDIILYDKKGKIDEWNDQTKNAVMNFKFIENTSAKLVISCKSLLKTSDVDKAYCEEVKKFVNRIWLFAECCGPRSPLKIKERAKQSGYEKFFFLYTWSEAKGIKPDQEGWIEFINLIREDIKNF